MGYNDTNRLAVVQQNGTAVATYGVNGLGERVTKTLAGGGTQVYVYDEGGRLLGEYAPGQSRDYVWADGTLVAILDNPAQGGDTIHYVYTDNLGTPRAVTTQSGTLVWAWPYTRNPFGEAPASTGGFSLALGFPGQYYDAETGLDYNLFRDYDPATGRYVESDPTGLATGVGTYVYVASNPLDLSDRHGKAAAGTRPLLPTNDDGEPIPGAWPTDNGDLRYVMVCVRGMCPTNPYACTKDTTPSMTPISFVGNPPTMYPTINKFQSEYPNCVCTHTMWADMTVPPGQPPASPYDYMDIANKIIEDLVP